MELHSKFLQCFLSDPVMHEDIACKRYSLLYENGTDYTSQQELKKKLTVVVREINTNIRQYSLQIRSCICEVSQEAYYVLIYTLENNIAKTMKLYSNTDVIFFKKVMDAIVTSADGYISSTDCLNLSTSVPISKIEGTTVLKKFIRDYWLVKKGGGIYISVRSRLELEPFMKVVYADFIDYCKICRQLSILGHRCENCDAKYHHHCLAGCLNPNHSSQCPSCQNTWDLPSSVMSSRGRISSGESLDDTIRSTDFFTQSSTRKETTRRSTNLSQPSTSKETNRSTNFSQPSTSKETNRSTNFSLPSTSKETNRRNTDFSQPSTSKETNRRNTDFSQPSTSKETSLDILSQQERDGETNSVHIDTRKSSKHVTNHPRKSSSKGSNTGALSQPTAKRLMKYK